jgi:hypothetical protein
MNLDETSFSEIEARLAEFQRLPGAAHTNYFRQTLTGTNYWSASGERSFIFVTDDLNFLRLYFLTKDPADLKNLLGRAALPRTTVTALVARQFQPEIDNAFLANGYRHHALFKRMTTRSLRVAKTNSRLDFAAPEDLDELLQRLKTDFDPYTSHPPSRAMLAHYIANQWVLVIREDGRIVGYIVFQIIGNQVNYNILSYTGARPGEFLFLQNNFLGLLAERKIRAGFLWVDETNTRVLKMNEAYGWKLDGLMTKYLITQPAI